MSPFTPKANIMFCHTIRFVFFAILIVSTSFEGSSVISTISAASIAASEPKAPIAIPISALARTGASLMPSPTKASFLSDGFSLSSASSFSTFWSGSSCVYTSSKPSFFAIASPIPALSPVSMTVLRIPLAFSPLIAVELSCLISSAMTIVPANFPLTAT
ncbi:hypothetical protein SDC9_194192 [bioreactor metagenome]|uniref:Uncharacterized protein n=1 Tax=bioreactor metagenome TaxID=1076179 RepID=A0A645I5L7_9ZZZZ